MPRQSTSDKKAVAEAVTSVAVSEAGFDSLDAAKEAGTAFVFLGHGTSHTAKVSYSQMQTQMTVLGYDNVLVGTVEGKTRRDILRGSDEQFRAGRL